MNLKTPLFGLATALLMVTIFFACQEEQTVSLSSKSILIEIQKDQILQNAKPGDEVPEFVSMYHAGSTARTTQSADLVTEVSPGEEITWTLNEDDEDIKILKIEFTLVSGENFFESSYSYLPQLQADGSWKAKVAADAEAESVMKYSVYFEIAGEGTFWWDPIVKITSGKK